MKRISAMLLALLIILSVSMPVTVYADDNDGWSNVTTHAQFVAGMKAYQKAFYNISTTFADVTYNDPVVSGIVSWSYGQWLKTANILKLDMNQLQANMRYRVNSSGALQFLYDGSYIQYYNALVQKYCEENGLDINANFNKTLYQGEVYTDPEGNTCYVTYINSNPSSSVRGATIPEGSYLGSAYKYDNIVNDPLPLSVSPTTSNENISITRDSQYQNNQKYVIVYLNGNNQNKVFVQGDDGYDNFSTNSSNLTIIKGKNGNYYLGSYIVYTRVSKSSPNDVNTSEQFSTYAILSNASNNALQALIQIGKDGIPKNTPTPDNSAIIQAGKYGADVAKAIDDYVKDDDPEEPEVDPPSGGTSTPPSGDDTLPGLSYDGKPFHFTMPDFSDFNWSISGLQDKFPFSIPFDMIDFFTVLDASPETPEFRVNVNIANVHVDETISLEVFDDYMPMFRNIILAGWCIFLIIATRSVFKVY